MDRRNGGDPLAPPRPPKSLPRVHRPRAPEPSMMSAPLTPVHQRQEINQQDTTTQQRPQQQQQQQQHHHQQQQQQLCTNSLLQNRSSNSIHSSNSVNSSTITNNNNNNVVNNSVGANNISNISSLNNNSSNNSSNSNRNSSSSNSSGTANNNNCNNNNVTIHPAPIITAPLIPLQLQQQPLNISNNLSSTTTVTSTNSFTRRRPPPPVITLPLLPSISSSILHNTESPVSPVTLAAPRPESERLTNEYVDTPFRTAQQLHHASRHQHPAGQTIHGQTTTHHNLLLLQSQRQQQQHQHTHSSSHNQPSSNTIISGTTTPHISGSGSSTLLHSNSSHKGSSNTTSSFGSTQTTTSATTLLLSGQNQRHQLPASRPSVLPITQTITKQPAPFSKDIPSSILHDDLDPHHIGSAGGAGDSLNSITCPQCKRCRCEQCQSPRQLPSRWVCNKTCLCSAETVIDYASCLCCVKALFYHCAKDHEMECDDGDSISCADDPCSCLPHKRAARWGWLCALSVALPCLWCYWPMRGCVAVCAKCYAKHSRHGCRCQSVGSTTMLPISPINSTVGTKSLGISSGINDNTVSHNHHNHHHHHSNSGIDNVGSTDGGGRTIIRTSDLTPEKRLLDSSPEY